MIYGALQQVASHRGPSRHFMRRLALGVTTESHPLYGTFMARLSSCIFEWDESDVEALLQAKGGELSMAGVPNPSCTRNNVQAINLFGH